MTPIGGVCDPAFAAVEAAFRENFALRDEVGAALCIRLGGRTVVDLWGGHREAERTTPWTRDTLVNAYSVGKGITAMLVLSLVERGELSLDAPVVTSWPEFGVQGKSATTLRMLLSHRGGLPGVRAPLAADAMYDWATMTGALAAQAPWWEPGSAHGYHVNSYGFLVGELVVRALAMPFARALRERLTGPLDADFHIGLPLHEHRRAATVVETSDVPIEEARQMARKHFASGDDAVDDMLAAAYFNPLGISGVGCVNDARWRSASIPSTNGHGTARAVAALYDAFLHRDVAHGGWVGSALRAEALAIASDGEDRVLRKPSRFGLGFQLAQPTRAVGTSDAAFGHFGYGGTLGFADPESGVAFAYLMNRPGERWHTPRTNALVDALRDALGAPSAPARE